MSIDYTTKINERLITISIVAESHIIGMVGVATYLPGFIRLIEVPQGPYPAVTIPGYTEIPGGIPTGSQFLVDYTNGVISFDTTQDGNTISASYTGLGSEIAAEDINELQEPLNSIGNLSITYNWPSAPTVSWTLAPNVVTNSTLANSSFTFPQSVYVTNTLGVGTISPVATAIVEIDSTTKGVLPPRMTSTQMNAISSPAEGLMLYITDFHQWVGWNGSSWVILG